MLGKKVGAMLHSQMSAEMRGTAFTAKLDVLSVK